MRKASIARSTGPPRSMDMRGVEPRNSWLFSSCASSPTYQGRKRITMSSYARSIQGSPNLRRCTRLSVGDGGCCTNALQRRHWRRQGTSNGRVLRTISHYSRFTETMSDSYASWIDTTEGQKVQFKLWKETGEILTIIAPETEKLWDICL